MSINKSEYASKPVTYQDAHVNTPIPNGDGNGLEEKNRRAIGRGNRIKFTFETKTRL